MKTLTLRFTDTEVLQIAQPHHIFKFIPNNPIHILRPFDLLLRPPFLIECPRIIRYLRKISNRKDKRSK